MKADKTLYKLLTIVLQAALLLGLLSAGWFVYIKLPHRPTSSVQDNGGVTAIQIVLRNSPELHALNLDIPVELYPVDIVAVRHEYFAERRAGMRFEDFLNERMKGRTPISLLLDKRGQASVTVGHGSWWVHAVLAGEEDLEWRLPITVAEQKQIVELTPDNAYTRTKSF